MGSNPTSFDNRGLKNEGELLHPADTRWLRFPMIRLLLALRTGSVVKEVYSYSPEQCAEILKKIKAGKQASKELIERMGWPEPDTNVWDEVIVAIERRLKTETMRREGRLDGDLFTRAKSSIDIVEYAARYTHLSPASTGKMKGVCPLHEEKTASFYVDEAKQTWRCFGACGRGGDVVLLANLLKAKGK